MKKFYLVVVLVIGGYFYSNPGLFDVMRAETGAKVEQGVGNIQAEVESGINDALKELPAAE